MGTKSFYTLKESLSFIKGSKIYGFINLVMFLNALDKLIDIAVIGRAYISLKRFFPGEVGQNYPKLVVGTRSQPFRVSEFRVELS